METIKIKSKTKQAKIVLEMLKTFPFVEFVNTAEKSTKKAQNKYNPKFVEAMKKSEKNIQKGEFVTVDTNNIWESLGLK